MDKIGGRLSKYDVFETHDKDQANEYLKRRLARHVIQADVKRFRLRVAAARVHSLLTAHAADTYAMKGAADPVEIYNLIRVEHGESDRHDDGHHRIIHPGSGILLPPGTTYVNRTSDPYSHTMIGIPASVFDLEAGKLLLDENLKRIETIKFDDLKSTVLGERITAMMANLETDMFQTLPRYAAGFERDFIADLIVNYAFQGSRIRRYGGLQKRWVRRMEDAMAADLTQSMGYYVAAAGCNAKTLRDACQREYGKTPSQVRHEMRVHVAIHRLENPRPGDHVETIADEFGLHPGRFAGECEKKTGENPLTILTRSKEKAGMDFRSAAGR